MKPILNIERVEGCLQWLEEMSDDVQVQSIAWYIEQINMLCKSLAYINGQLAVAGEQLNQKKAKAYESLAASSVAQQQYFAPSLAKDYIASKCSTEQYHYNICERASRSIVHILDAYRSSLSALKEESKTLSYQR
jgi:hypothetical protein